MSKESFHRQPTAPVSSFSASIKLRLPSGAKQPLHPVFCDTGMKNGIRGQTRYYAAAPGEPFVVECTNMFGNAATGDFGGYVFVDQGETPPPVDQNTWDHAFTWGPIRERGDRSYDIEGYTKNRDEAYSFRFDHTLPPGERALARCSDEDPKIGWIVVRFFKVTGYEEAETEEAARPAQRQKVTKDDVKNMFVTPCQPGEVVQSSVTHGRESPIFAAEPIYESRVRWLEWPGLVAALKAKQQHIASLLPDVHRAIPFAALHAPRLRTQVIEQLLVRARKVGESGTTGLLLRAVSDESYVALEDIVQIINLHFDPIAARIVCCGKLEHLKPLADAAKVQGDPVVHYDEDLDAFADESGCVSLEKLDEDAHFDEKLHGLHSFLTDHLDSWEIASRGSLSLPPGVGRGIQMRKRILNLSTSGSSSGGMGCTIAVKVVDQDGREDAYIVEMDNSLAPMMDQYCHTRGIGDSSRSTLRFLFDGERVNSHQTPRMLELEDGDCIDVMTEQLGGVE